MNFLEHIFITFVITMSLESSYKNTAQFFTKLINTKISIIKILFRSKFGTKFPKASSNSCIVLGNGPSLNESIKNHPEFFKKHELLCVNSFSITDLYQELKPSYYVMLDPGFWFGDSEFIINTINALKVKTTWPMVLFLPHLAKKSSKIKEVASNSNIKIQYFNYTVFKGFDSIAYWFYKKNLAMSQSQNVLVGSLFLSINLGFKEVYLFGADQTWHHNLHVNENNVPCIKNVHFYENQEKVEYKPFYKGAHSKEIFRMDEIFVIFSKAFFGYYSINKYAQHMKCTIYNAGEHSAIDAFKRIKIN